jgi:ArsR family transcriptional regulator
MSTGAILDPESIAKGFQALADKKRLEIIGLLTSGERCVCELTGVLGAKQPLLSFHLKILREVGLVRSRRRGKWMYYSLNYETLEELKAIVSTFSDGKAHQESCCCESLCSSSEAHPT